MWTTRRLALYPLLRFCDVHFSAFWNNSRRSSRNYNNRGTMSFLNESPINLSPYFYYCNNYYNYYSFYYYYNYYCLCTTTITTTTTTTTTAPDNKTLRLCLTYGDSEITIRQTLRMCLTYCNSEITIRETLRILECVSRVVIVT